MEKKGNFFNQIAIISDLLEKINLESESRTVIFELKEDEFNRIFNLNVEKTKQKISPVTNKFSIKIGDVDVVFSKSNV
jgi:hypothetical protein